MPSTLAVLGTLVALGVGAAGCGGEDEGVPEQRSDGKDSVTATVEPVDRESLPDLSEVCGSDEGLDAEPIVLKTEDEIPLYAVRAGAGKSSVVLVHEGRDNLCGWLPEAQRLAGEGFRVLLFDLRGNGQSPTPDDQDAALRLDYDLAAAVASERKDGAKRVFLLGASLGGAASVQNGARLPVDGIISLSGTRIWRGYGINHPAWLPRMHSPFLYLGTAHDGRAPKLEAERIFARVGSKDKRLVTFRGDLHGTQLVDMAPFKRQARAIIVRWLKVRS
jgi:pimeloyl-ACP methyl ester carboxylesterase